MITTESVVAAEIMSSTTIWYFAAITGSAPARIWPDIMPGICTMPAADSWAKSGVMPAPTAALMEGNAASRGMAPKATIMYISFARESMLANRRSVATAAAASVLPRIMPEMGTSCMALYHGSAWMMPSTTMNAMTMDDTVMERKTSAQSPRTTLFVRPVAICVAAMHMPSSTKHTSHHV